MAKRKSVVGALPRNILLMRQIVIVAGVAVDEFGVFPFAPHPF